MVGGRLTGCRRPDGAEEIRNHVIVLPVEPLFKLTANPITASSMAEHIDLDISGLLRLEYDLVEAGNRLKELVDRTVNGRFSATEAIGHREFVLTKLYRSA